MPANELTVWSDGSETSLIESFHRTALPAHGALPRLHFIDEQLLRPARLCEIGVVFCSAFLWDGFTAAKDECIAALVSLSCAYTGGWLEVYKYVTRCLGVVDVE